MKSPILFFSFLFSITLFAQQNKMGIGIIAGPSVSIIRGNIFQDTTHVPAIGFSSGINFEFIFSKERALVFDIVFDHKVSGNTYKLQQVNSVGSTIGIEVIRSKTYLNYLTIPILFRKNFVYKKISPFVNAGIFMGYLIRKGSYSDSSYYFSTSIKYNESFDAGISAGFGSKLELNNKIACSIELRNNLGLYDINRNKSSSSYSTSIRTNSTYLLFGFIYRIHKPIEKIHEEDYR